MATNPGEYYPHTRSDFFCSIHGYNCNHPSILLNFYPGMDYSHERLGIKSDFESIRDKLLKDPEFIKAIYEGLATMQEVKTTTWLDIEDALRELDDKLPCKD